MKAEFLKTRKPKQQTMADMKPGQLAEIQGHNRNGEIVFRSKVPNEFKIISLADGDFWSAPNSVKVRILEPGEQTLLTQE